jgi:hypothetical protein
MSATRERIPLGDTGTSECRTPAVARAMKNDAST